MPGTRFSITLPPGGGGIIGEATVWEDAGNWESLPTIDLREGDRAFVIDLNQPSASGTAEYNGEDWQLAQGFFQSEADLTEFTEIVGLEASAYVLTGTDLQDGAGRFYYYDGADWVRTPKDTGYIYPNAADVSEVLAIVSPRDEDRVRIEDTGFGTYGYAVYVAESSMWKFVEGWFHTVADMESFSTDPDNVRDYAIASVGSYGPASPHYVFNADPGEWVRTPDGVKYIWPQVPDWDALLSPTPARPYAKNDDEVHVHELNAAHSSGTAQKHGGGWRLIEGRWASVEDMNAWADDDIFTGARGLVDPDRHWDEDAVPYYYNGSVWLLAGGPPADAKAVTEIELGQLEEPGQNINEFFLNYPISQITETA